MKKALIIVGIIAFVAAGSSCKKCQTCEVSDGAAQFGTPTNVCGSKKDLEAQESICITSANNISGSKCTCIED